MVCSLVTHEAVVLRRDMKSTSSSTGGSKWGIEIKNYVALISHPEVKERLCRRKFLEIDLRTGSVIIQRFKS